MYWSLDDAAKRKLVAWIERGLPAESAYGRGYQGQTFLYEADGQRLIVKVALGRGPIKWLHQAMLRREAAVYARLHGFGGAPRCYGLIEGRYLILEYVRGERLRQRELIDANAFFDTLYAHLAEMHRRGVAHADLKRKDNLLMIDRRTPCLIDFGTAVVRKPGFAPINQFLYRIARQFDYNAWVKLKYRNKLERVSETDRTLYQRTRIEKLASLIKRGYLRLKAVLGQS